MIQDYFSLAFKSFRHRKIRSWLTVLGIFIGIAAVISLISLGQGLEAVITEQFEQIGTDKLTVFGKAGTISGPLASAISEKPLTVKDVEKIKSLSSVDIVAPMLINSVQATHKKETENLLVHGFLPDETSEIFKDLNSFEVEFGRDLVSKDKLKIVLAYDAANSHFNEELKVRDKITISGKEFKIIGILKEIGTPDDSVVHMHIDDLREITNEPELISMIFIQVKKGLNPENVKFEVEKLLRDIRNEKEGEESFTVTTSQQLLKTFGNIIGVVQLVLIGIAAISLLVGGIGIMNTMYTSVLERTREIGIMKAVGAKNKDIMILFLIESGLLGVVGGIIGVLVGIGLSKTVELIVIKQGFTLLRAVFPYYLILGALLFSFIVGSLSGLLPAIQASKLNPVDALRYE